MLTDKCMDEYRKAFPKDDCFFSEPSCYIMICNKTNNNMFLQPHDETEEIFLERLERSIRDGKNYFYEEWQPFEYEKGWIY